MSDPFALSPRIERIQPSITLAVTALAKKLAAEGVDVIGFGAGEPDFDTPEHVKEAAKAALDRGETKYTPAAGSPELRKAVASSLSSAHGLTLGPQQVAVCSGAKHALYTLFQVLLGGGDEVIIPAPYWVSYPDMVLLADGRPVIVPTSAADDFCLTPESLRWAITPRTRALVLCSPSNPTGAGYSKERLEALVPVLEESGLVVISDDIYRLLTYGDFEYTHITELSNRIAERCVLIDGLSKSHSMTGWRIGYAAGPAPLIAAMEKLLGQSTSNVCSITQAAAIAALEGSEDCVSTMRAAFDQRRRVMMQRLRAIDGVTCHEPEGAFYAFPDLGAYLGRRTPGGDTIADDVTLCQWLLSHARIALVPGSGFGAPGHVRLSYATSMENIETGLGRLATALGELG